MQFQTLTLLLLQTAAVVLAREKRLFQPWNATEWVSSDDSVRPGGQSYSSLEVLPMDTDINPYAMSIVRFSGNLDYEALNGSGFASQRTFNGWEGLDLSAFDRLVLQLPFADGKTYSLNLKDTLADPVNGVEQASLSWEYDFRTTAKAIGTGERGSYEQVEIMFADLMPTFQGRVQTNAAPLNLASIVRASIMIRR